jgi:thiamine phosphate synthase YjbQ (UPF0047 family)
MMLLVTVLSSTTWHAMRPAGVCASRLSRSTTMSSTIDRESVCVYEQLVIPSPAEGPPAQEITVVDLMPHIRRVLAASGLRDGSINIISRHTTTAITINEWENRLACDLRTWLLRLAPPDDRSEIGVEGAGVSYFHNDIEARPDSEDERQRCLDNGWDVENPAELERWRDQEPINAHSHLAAMMLGSSEVVPVVDGTLVLGQWQSVMLVDVDGPRERTVGIQAVGFK